MSGKNTLIVGAIFLILGFIATFLFFSVFKEVRYPYEARILGVDVYSMVPLHEIPSWLWIYLEKTNDRAALICNFEIAAVSYPSLNGYKISFRKGNKNAIYISKKSAVIQGTDDANLLKACHVFFCLRENITLASNLSEISSFLKDKNEIYVIYDKSLGIDGLKGYAEIMMVLGYIQSKTLKLIDYNGDGIIDEKERNKSMMEHMLKIYPFMRNGSICVPQPFKSLYQEFIPENKSYNCSNLKPAIILSLNKTREIRVEDTTLILMGDDKGLHSEAILLRDILEPEFIVVMHEKAQ
ncbi:MAG: hypothetical protein DRO65_02880 [Candidatus Altiarchaeales archaeon]|nr:MAG: hypothetical protein DRO65_02880 [Candidatus Altiarchaeales archaeon]